MVSLPHRLAASPSAVRNHRSARQRARHCCSVNLESSRVWRTLASRRPPRHTDTRPAASRPSTAASSACRCCSRACLANRSARLAYPRTRPCRCPTGTTSRERIVWAARRSAILRSVRLVSARCHWSLEVRVIDPAQRLDAWLVRVRLRAARWSGAGPSRHRQARSAPARRPRYSPTARTTASSAAESRSRVRIRAPAGGATTNGSLIERMFPCYRKRVTVSRTSSAGTARLPPALRRSLLLTHRAR
jgi:hypothetical protein